MTSKEKCRLLRRIRSQIARCNYPMTTEKDLPVEPNAAMGKICAFCGKYLSEKECIKFPSYSFDQISDENGNVDICKECFRRFTSET